MTRPTTKCVDDVPRCTKRCAHYIPGEGDYQPPSCGETGNTWPLDRICLPEVQRLVREARKAVVE